jgi:hypothetical protein
MPGAALSMTDVPAWESSILDLYLTNTQLPWAEPTVVPANDSPSSNDTSSIKLPNWAAALLGLAITILSITAFMLLANRDVKKATKAKYLEALKTEPDLSWEMFEERARRKKEVNRGEHKTARQRINERKAAKSEARIAKWMWKWKGEAKGNGSTPDGDILLHSMEGQSGKSDFDDSVPPPYSSVVEEPRSVVGKTL